MKYLNNSDGNEANRCLLVAEITDAVAALFVVMQSALVQLEEA